MKLINKEIITWHFCKPPDFPCYICHDNTADYRATYKYGTFGAKITLPVCGPCSEMEITEKSIIKN